MKPQGKFTPPIAAIAAALAGDLENAAIASTPGGIERQEAEGQRTLVASTKVPTELLYSTQAEFEALGFVFGAIDASDPLFRECSLPAGWSKKGTDHSMWSTIVDERGRERASMFYKAAFYDRLAFMSLSKNPDA